MAYFQRINTFHEFINTIVGDFTSIQFSNLPARYYHNGRYLTGYVEASVLAGFFIYENQKDQNMMLRVGHYGFELLFNWMDNLEWRLHLPYQKLDMVNAFPADPRAKDELLYFGRCYLNDILFYGTVRSNGMIYILTPEGRILELPEFEILEYKQSKPEERKATGVHRQAEVKVIPAKEVILTE